MKRKKIKADLKEKLLNEMGNKCANPGCANIRTHLHHIKEWAIYQSDDPAILIPVCPTCHDAIHHGKIKITENELLGWKQIKRNQTHHRAHVYIEPSNEFSILLGPYQLKYSENEIIVLDFDGPKLAFSIRNSEIFLTDAIVSDLFSNQLIVVVQNHVKVTNDPDISFETHPGRVIVKTNTPKKFIPNEVINHYFDRKKILPNILFDIHITSPGHVKIEGIWSSLSRTVFIDWRYWSLFKNGKCIGNYGAYGVGEPPILKIKGKIPIINYLFDFMESRNL